MLMIQIISNNALYEKFDKNIYCISKINEFKDFDNFNLNVIDLNYQDIWKNNKSNTTDINNLFDLLSLKSAISENEKSEIVILFPQNLIYEYNKVYQERDIYKYEGKENLKNIILNFRSIICNSLVSIDSIEIFYGKNDIEIDGVKYKSDFYFSNVEKENIIQKASNKKSNVIIKQNDIILTTLEIDTEEKLKKMIQKIFPDIFDKTTEIPEWFYDIEFYNDKELINQICELDNKIKLIKQEKNNLNEQVKINNKYKSILYETGNILANIINEMLSQMLDYDLSNFEDKYEEDGLIKLKEITFIIETKGLKNEIKGEDVSKAFAHLIVYDDSNFKNKIEENTKCLFFATYERLKPILERVPIHERIETLAKSNKTLVIDNRIFLDIYEDYLNKKINRDDIVKLFIDNVGILKYKKSKNLI